MRTVNATPMHEPATALMFRQQALDALVELASVSAKATKKAAGLTNRIVSVVKTLYCDRYVDAAVLSAANCLTVVDAKHRAGVVPQVLEVLSAVRIEPLGVGR